MPVVDALFEDSDVLLEYAIISTYQRLTFDIRQQTKMFIGTETMRRVFKADNGVEIISQSQIDIQVDQLWLLGEKGITRSGSMVFSDNSKRDKAAVRFHLAIEEWARVLTGKHICDNASPMSTYRKICVLY